MSRTAPARRLAAALVAALSLVACRPTGPAATTGATGEPPTPPPPFAGGIDRASPEEVLRYARSLQFDDRAGAGDRQRLMLGTCPADCRYGPLARIEPQVGAHALADSGVASGRIVARLVNEDDQPYPKLFLEARDTTYLWVDSTDGAWRARFISTRAGGKVRPAKLTREYHPERTRRWLQAVARWDWREADEQAWVTCGEGCCKTDP